MHIEYADGCKADSVTYWKTYYKELAITHESASFLLTSPASQTTSNKCYGFQNSL